MDESLENIKKEVKNKKETLEDLLSKITPENIHPEIDWGKPVGKEIC